jgi:redox-sensitive bicupin YhaK (pirin superfamily)
MIERRAAAERGHATHGWLDSHHSFSFADYHDPKHMGYGPLRVINEDRVEPGAGFGMHGHRDMEILSYVLEGELAHRDSMGNGSTILQIWIEPAARGIDPGYEQVRVPDEAKRGRLTLVAGPAGSGAAVTIHQDASVYATMLDGAETVEHPLAPGRRAYVHVARGEVRVNGVALGAGDAVKLAGESSVRMDGGAHAEALIFDLP